MTEGEWWLIDGVAHYADGDVGDKNHEAYVHDHVYAELRDKIEEAELYSGLQEIFASEETPDATTLRTNLNDWSDRQAKELPDDHPDKEPLYDDVYAWLAEKTGLTEKDLNWVFNADSSTVDLREYGMRKLGWIRVAGNQVELYKLTPAKLKEMARGLWAACDEEVEALKFDIAERSANFRYFSDVPYLVIASGKMAAVREYLRTPKVQVEG
jgi:hypothetical protein